MALNSRENFIPLLKYFPVKPTCTTLKNPQANSILEVIHQVVGIMFKTKYLANFMFDAVPLWSDILAYTAYAVRCSYHITLKSTPEKLVFGRDIPLDINFEPNYKDMWLSKQ